tara:strand:+ start:114 stop:473 length:360 start_codon:yes stop_codon:yes gene_type:complete
MEDLELSWQTFEFHTASAINLELSLNKYSELYVVKKKDGQKVNNLLDKIIKFCDLLINDYKKQNICLSELVEIYKYYSLHGFTVPVEREISLKYLHELKNTNATLIEELERKKRTFKLL